MSLVAENKRILLNADPSYCGHSKGLIAAIAKSCGLSVVEDSLREASQNVVGVILIGEAKLSRDWENTGVPLLHIMLGGKYLPDANLRFGGSLSVPKVYRGKAITASVAQGPPSLPKGEVLASVDGVPLWVKTERGHHLVVGNEWDKSTHAFAEYLSAGRVLDVLPLVEWMRGVSGWHTWTHPGLRGCLMFDDPNLHSTGYGFIDFHDLGRSGANENYHTSFATVPLDAYYASSAAVRVFREHQSTLSLLIHGNDHVYRELAQKGTPDRLGAITWQAMKRILAFEQKTKLKVCKVMAPPHGVCSQDMMAAMRLAGFEAVCVSHGSARTGTPGGTWTASLGLNSATMVFGLSVIPRFGLTADIERNALQCAYLNQAVIPVGHHWDLAGGKDLLLAAARTINGIGETAWMNLTQISRTNYSYRIKGRLMEVCPFANRVTVTVPDGVEELRISPTWRDLCDSELVWESKNAGQLKNLNGGFDLKVLQHGTFDLGFSLTTAAPLWNGRSRRTDVSAILRRALSEARDRAMPYLKMPKRAA